MMASQENLDLEKEEILDEVENVEQQAEEVEAELDPCEELKKKIEELEKQCADMKDAMLRQAAETENYKKRLLKDKENAVRFANESLVKDLLDPLDNFSRAIQSADQNADIETLKSGIAMVEDQLLSVLKTNWGLEVIEAKDKPFNPEEMEAYSMQEQEGLEKETVLMEFQKGYKLHGKVIRSSKVMVGKPKA